MIGRPVFLLQNISQFWDSTCKVSRLEIPITPQLWCFAQLLWKFIRSVYLDWIQNKHLHIPGQNQTTTVPKLDIPKLDIDHYLDLFGTFSILAIIYIVWGQCKLFKPHVIYMYSLHMYIINMYNINMYNINMYVYIYIYSILYWLWLNSERMNNFFHRIMFGWFPLPVSYIDVSISVDWITRISWSSFHWLNPKFSWWKTWLSHVKPPFLLIESHKKCAIFRARFLVAPRNLLQEEVQLPLMRFVCVEVV